MGSQNLITKILAWAGLTVLGAVMLSGCQKAAEDPAVTAERRAYLLDEEPSGAIGILEAREILAENAALDTPVALLGMTGDDDGQSWDPSKAEFVISDPTAAIDEGADHGGEGHDPSSCPFCKAKAAGEPEPVALVRVTDSDGKVVGHDARKLFQLEPGQLVVVRGRLSVDAIGNLVVAADGVYPRR